MKYFAVHQEKYLSRIFNDKRKMLRCPKFCHHTGGLRKGKIREPSHLTALGQRKMTPKVLHIPKHVL
jgi:hypothetical protein